MIVRIMGEGQLEIDDSRLTELNPGFDGQVQSDIRGGQVKGLSFPTHAVKDLAPLRAARARITEIDAELAALGGDERARAREIDLRLRIVSELREPML